MVSLSEPTCLIRSKASLAVMVGFRVTYSVVIMEPALFPGYFRISLMSLRMEGSAEAKILFTTFAGISSMMSTVSSTYSSSTRACNS